MYGYKYSSQYRFERRAARSSFSNMGSLTDCTCGLVAYCSTACGLPSACRRASARQDRGSHSGRGNRRCQARNFIYVLQNSSDFRVETLDLWYSALSELREMIMYGLFESGMEHSADLFLVLVGRRLSKQRTKTITHRPHISAQFVLRFVELPTLLAQFLVQSSAPVVRFRLSRSEVVIRLQQALANVIEEGNCAGQKAASTTELSFGHE